MEDELAQDGKPTSAGVGVVAVEGNGNATIDWARVLRNVGYDAVLFVDSDVEADRAAADALKEIGVAVVRWKDGFNVERAVTDVLNSSELTALIEKAIELSDDPSSSRNNMLDHLKAYGLPEAEKAPVVGDWIEHGFNLDAARETVALAAHKRSWFKRVDKGQALATLFLEAEGFTDSESATKVQALRDAVFAPPQTAKVDASAGDDAVNVNEQ
jgi:putative ATP-dependent endonuclease of OLD family